MAGQVPRITPQVLETARTCIRAAEMRSECVLYAEIARRLGLPSPQAAHDAVAKALRMVKAMGTD